MGWYSWFSAWTLFARLQPPRRQISVLFGHKSDSSHSHRNRALRYACLASTVCCSRELLLAIRHARGLATISCCDFENSNEWFSAFSTISSIRRWLLPWFHFVASTIASARTYLLTDVCSSSTIIRRTSHNCCNIISSCCCLSALRELIWLVCGAAGRAAWRNEEHRTIYERKWSRFRMRIRQSWIRAFAASQISNRTGYSTNNVGSKSHTCISAISASFPSANHDRMVLSQCKKNRKRIERKRRTKTACISRRTKCKSRSRTNKTAKQNLPSCSISLFLRITICLCRHNAGAHTCESTSKLCESASCCCSSCAAGEAQGIADICTRRSDSCHLNVHIHSITLLHSRTLCLNVVSFSASFSVSCDVCSVYLLFC